MVKIPDRLRCLFSATLERRDDSYLLEVPREELDRGEVTDDEIYRVAILRASSRPGATVDDDRNRRSDPPEDGERSPPVEAGDVRKVTIETLGDQGDGIAKIERGYVVIVPDTRPDDEVTIEIEQTRENVAFARVRDDNRDSDGSLEFDDGFADETLGDDE